MMKRSARALGAAMVVMAGSLCGCSGYGGSVPKPQGAPTTPPADSPPADDPKPKDGGGQG